MWFEALTGFREESPDQVRANLIVDGETVTSAVNGQRFRCGRLGIPSLAELRGRVEDASAAVGRLRLSEVIADVQQLHVSAENAGALFQVASQFNLLEMVSPSVTPEAGVGIYENDRTQGPACAIACGAGTIYRNYFVRVDGIAGQTADRQVDCLHDLGQALGNSDESLWTMRNGYALATRQGLESISEQLSRSDEDERDRLRGLLRIGVQWGTQVTIDDAAHNVTQAYCSALPVAYSSQSSGRWAAFAELVLEASYEATLCAAILNRADCGSNRVFLTLLGGGAFGNETGWIISALDRVVRRFADFDLDISIVSYGSSKPAVQRLIDDHSRS
jgi:hypothetical protein